MVLDFNSANHSVPPHSVAPIVPGAFAYLASILPFNRISGSTTPFWARFRYIFHIPYLKSSLLTMNFLLSSSNCQHFSSIAFHQSRCDWLWAGDNRSLSLKAVYNKCPLSVFLQDLSNAKFLDCPSMAQIDSRSERTA